MFAPPLTGIICPRTPLATFLFHLETTKKLTIDPFAIRARQQTHHLPNVLRYTAAVQRTAVSQGLLNIRYRRPLVTTRGITPRIRHPHVTLNTRRSNRVDSTLLLPKVCRKAARKALDGRLATSIQGVTGDTNTSRDGRHEDYTAAGVDVVVGSLSDKELRARVEVEHLVEGFEGCFR